MLLKTELIQFASNCNSTSGARRATGQAFKGDEYQILLVTNKFRTGFQSRSGCPISGNGWQSSSMPQFRAGLLLN